MKEKEEMLKDCAANGSRCLLESPVRHGAEIPDEPMTVTIPWPHELSDDLPAKI